MRGRRAHAAPLRGRGRREGFVLAASLLAVLLIAALMAAVFFATTEDTRTAAALGLRQHAFLETESALESAAASLNPATMDSLPVGATSALGSDGPGVVSGVYVTRLDSSVFSLVSDAPSHGSNSAGAGRVGLLVRLSVDANGSITIDRIPERAWSELF
jgi:hypothetical protein